MSMTNHEGDDRIAQHLRQRFFAWSVAIVSSLGTSGLVTLSPTKAWCQEDSATAVDDQDKDTSTVQAEFDPQAFNQLLRNRKYDVAAEMLDAALKTDPLNPRYANLNLSLSMGMAGSSREAAVERLQKQYQELLAVTVLNASQSSLMASTATAMTTLMREASGEEKLAIIDEAAAKLEVSKDVNPASFQSLALTKARLLLMNDRAEDAKDVLDALLMAARAEVDPTSPATRRNLLTFSVNYASMLARDFPEAVAEVEQQAEQLALAAFDKAATEEGTLTLADVQSYVSLKTSMAGRLRSSNPSAAMEILDDVSQRLQSAEELLPEGQAQGLSRFEGQITSLRSQLETALKREQLVGTVAPQLDAAHFVAMNPVTMDELKGKVVLLDFWAVWCGPCIATFPHLIQWHEEFADEGLVIIGVTKFYGYGWNEEAGRAQKAEGVSEEEELAMLEKFRESYDLHHGFVVTPQGSNYSQEFMVTGIPQAVLIDKEGKIRMVRVGSGDANAQDLEAEIKSLLHGAQ